MITASEIQDKARRDALDLVEHEIRRLGSKMRAYGAVARVVGVSESWVRKLIGRQPVAVAAHEYLNLETARRTLERDNKALEEALHERDNLLARLANCEAVLGLSSSDGPSSVDHAQGMARRSTDRTMAEGR